MSVLYHGGVSGLKPGDLIEPGHSRDDQHDDCPICRGRRELGADAPEGTRHPENVYCTTDRLYARLYASMVGRGDVYQVEPVGPLVPSTDEGVTLSMKERRRLARRDPDPVNPLPRNATDAMVERWWRRQLAMAERTMRNGQV